MNGISVLVAVLATVQMTECGKCDKRFRITDDNVTAMVNVARLKDDAPDAGAGLNLGLAAKERDRRGRQA